MLRDDQVQPRSGASFAHVVQKLKTRIGNFKMQFRDGDQPSVVNLPRPCHRRRASSEYPDVARGLERPLRNRARDLLRTVGVVHDDQETHGTPHALTGHHGSGRAMLRILFVGRQTTLDARVAALTL